MLHSHTMASPSSIAKILRSICFMPSRAWKHQARAENGSGIKARKSRRGNRPRKAPTPIETIAQTSCSNYVCLFPANNNWKMRTICDNNSEHCLCNLFVHGWVVFVGRVSPSWTYIPAGAMWGPLLSKTVCTIKGPQTCREQRPVQSAIRSPRWLSKKPRQKEEKRRRTNKVKDKKMEAGNQACQVLVSSNSLPALRCGFDIPSISNSAAALGTEKRRATRDHRTHNTWHRTLLKHATHHSGFYWPLLTKVGKYNSFF